MPGKEAENTPLAQSLLAKVQLGLPGTVTRLSAKMRFIDEIAPLLRSGGVIRPVNPVQPLTVRAAGIATGHKTAPAFGGLLYCAGAVRQDIYVEDGSLYQTYQDSTVEIDELDDLDVAKKMKLVHMIQGYQLLDELMDETDKPGLVLVDAPLILEQNDVPMENQHELQYLYDKCRGVIEEFWTRHRNKVFPFNPQGVYMACINNKRFGAIFYGLTSDKRKYIIDEIDDNVFSTLKSKDDRIKRVGVKKLLNGALTKRSRTAAYTYDMLTDRNRIEPQIVKGLGLTSFHLRAGLSNLPLQVEMVGGQPGWDTEHIDRLASLIVSLITIDQPQALPLPLWYAEYALKPIGSGVVLQYFKTQAREMIKNEEVESIWKEGLDIFEEGSDE